MIMRMTGYAAESLSDSQTGGLIDWQLAVNRSSPLADKLVTQSTDTILLFIQVELRQ